MITLSLPVSFYAAHVLTPPSSEHACLHNNCRCRPCPGTSFKCQKFLLSSTLFAKFQEVVQLIESQVM